MHNTLIRILYIALAVQLLTACSSLQIIGSVTGQASLQNQRATNAGIALQGLDEIDALVKLDNRWLADQIDTALTTQAASSERFSFSRLKIDFARQTISIDALIDINDQQGNVISAVVDGDILLDFSGDQLEWLPRFSQLQVSSKDFKFEDGTYAEPIPELTAQLQQEFNAAIAEPPAGQNRHVIALTAVPLGDVRVGASIPELSASPARQTQALSGIFMVAGSVMLIDSATTTIALDMAFIPDLSTCPADVTVSRAEFASGIESREPVGVVSDIKNADEIRYFFSEISGAKRPLTIVHYWFGDGLPIAVEELPVKPSERWRTWSTKGATEVNVNRWEVLVVDKDSGCILQSRTIRAVEPEISVTQVDQAEARRTFETFRDEFNSKTSGFSISEDKPGIALVEVRRAFYGDVLQASLADLNMDAAFDSATFSGLDFSASLLPFKPEDISCEQRSCPPAPECKTNITQCKRLRDTRDCSSCQFRNPLNNRCISEAIDPLCEASRNRQNAKYDAARAACIADAEAARQKCEQLAAQALRSCEIELGFEDSVCESIKGSMASLGEGVSLAKVSTQAQASGLLSANFSNFRIEGDLQRLKLDMALKSALQLRGDLKFIPAAVVRPLSQCIEAWNVPFENKFVTKSEVSNLQSTIEENPDSLTASWSGFGLTIESNTSPLELIFVGNPQLLADCSMGLTVSHVEEAISGDDAGFFTGHIDLEIQPLPTIIKLAPASIGV